MTQNGKGDKQRVCWSREFEEKFNAIFKKGKHDKQKKKVIRKTLDK
jgi:hypothetical protein